MCKILVCITRYETKLQIPDVSEGRKCPSIVSSRVDASHASDALPSPRVQILLIEGTDASAGGIVFLIAQFSHDGHHPNV